MNKRQVIIFFSMVAIALIFSGCATYGGWKPVVDTYNDPNAARVAQDDQECEALAKQAGSVGTETAKSAAVGGLVGAAAGAAIGAAVGNPGTGAAIGAASGGIGGGTFSGVGADEEYKRAFSNCMRQRGHKVIN